MKFNRLLLLLFLIHQTASASSFDAVMHGLDKMTDNALFLFQLSKPKTPADLGSGNDLTPVISEDTNNYASAGEISDQILTVECDDFSTTQEQADILIEKPLQMNSCVITDPTENTQLAKPQITETKSTN